MGGMDAVVLMRIVRQGEKKRKGREVVVKCIVLTCTHRYVQTYVVTV